MGLANVNVRTLIRKVNISRGFQYVVASTNLFPYGLSSFNIRNFRTSQRCLAKSKKGKQLLNENIQEKIITVPDCEDFEILMDKRVKRLIDELSHFHGGRISTDMLNHIAVEAYGSKVPLSEAGQVTLKAATKLSVAVFDPILTPAVAKAITESGMNLNPVIDGNTLEIAVPKPSKEFRESLIKSIGKAAEKTKSEIRGIRKSGMDKIKEVKDSISEDDSRKVMKELDVITEREVARVVKLVTEKEKEIISS